MARNCVIELPIQIFKMERSYRSENCRVAVRSAMKPLEPYLNRFWNTKKKCSRNDNSLLPVGLHEIEAYVSL
jgi:hypothetical protein